MLISLLAVVLLAKKFSQDPGLAQNGGEYKVHKDGQMVKEFEEDTEDEVFPTEASAAVVLRNATKRLRRQGVEMSLKTGKGDIADEIIAESANHDLLVMHSMAPSGRFRLRSSRTKKVIRAAQCNVLLMQDC